jgi:molecular chaperone DnaJ
LRTPYEILGVAKTATAEDITKAYRKLARQYHPDRNPGDDTAVEKFKEVQAAYEMLSDPDKRAEYDRYGTAGPRRPQSHGPQNPFRRGKPFSSIFDDFFGGGFRQRQPTQPDDSGDHISVVTEVTLEQVFSGAEIEVPVTRHKVCQSCDGVGGIEEECEHCNGTGLRTIVGENMTVQTNCAACDSTGKVKKTVCGACQGTGYSDPETEIVKFKVPAGVEHGMRFVQPGKGEPCNDKNGRPGNLYITVAVKDHDLFKRGAGGSILIELPVSFTQLVFGDTIEVPTVGGKRLNFTLPAGTQAGAKFRLSDMGLPIFNNGGPTYEWGDQLVQVKLEVPTAVDDRYKDVLRQLADLERESPLPLKKAFLSKLGENDGTT